MAMELLFALSFLLCLAGYITHTLEHYLEARSGKKKSGAEQNKIVEFMIHTGYLGWGLMIFSDRSQIALPLAVIMPVGLTIGLIGMVLFLGSAVSKKGFTDVENLVTSGMYSRLRHPMYLGIILIHIGFPLAFSRYLTLLSALLWVPMVLYWKYLEEKELEEKFGQAYRDYRKRTFF